MSATFASLQLRSELLSVLEKNRISEPTSVQQLAIPIVAERKDAVVQSGTGTGKTLAYLLPLLQNINADLRELQAAVLVPTRELAMQILREAENYGQPLGIVSQPLIGGAAIGRQIEKLRTHPQLIVGTPGRVLELIRLKKLKMHFVKSIVIDEADQIFALGGVEQVEEILRKTLRERQVLFFSATVSNVMEEAARRWMREPQRVTVDMPQRTPETLEHLYFACEERDKIDLIRRIVRSYDPARAIVFVNETDRIAEVTEKLKYVGLKAEAIYGDAAKLSRSAVLERFRSGRFRLLVATDVAARGLDIEGLTHIINFDVPPDAEHYIHRAGRTGRMGRKGTVLTIVTGREKYLVNKLEKNLGITIDEKAMYQGRVIDRKTDPRVWAKLHAAGRKQTAKRDAIAREESPFQKRNVPAESYAETESAGKMRRRPSGAAGAKGVTAAARRGAKGAAGASPKRSERERDRKNKGAPKWLKAKQEKERT